MSQQGILGNILAKRAAVQEELKEGVQISVLAEEFREDGAYDFDASFINAQPGESWTLKPVFNIENVEGKIQGNILHRQVYKKLPDPDRKGKTFRYVSSGSSKTCPVMELFFEIYAKEKANDFEAGQIRKKYVTAAQEGAILVQVISGPKPEDKGKLRWLPYHTSGEAPFIANLIKGKINPKKNKPEDIFDIFPTSLLYLETTKSTFADGGEGRNHNESTWSIDEKSSILLFVNGAWTSFTMDDVDLNTGQFKDPAVNEAYLAFVESLKNPEISAKNVFMWKKAGDTEGITEATAKHTAEVWDKVQRVVPVIKAATTLAGLQKELGTVGAGEGNATMIDSGVSAQDVLKNSVDVAQLENQTATFNPAAQTQQANPTAQQANTGAPNFQNMLDSANQ